MRYQKVKHHISVIIPTYNRAEILRQTLTSMTRLDRDGLSVEFVVVDNNNSDHTKQVIESFTDRLPIRYLFEPRPGQNYARNRALADAELGRLVVFTDDDVKPQKEWLKAIVSISKRWPDYSVFGGKIHPIWPDTDIPEWVYLPSISELSFVEHNHGDKEGPYEPNIFPFSPNFWVRRKVFENGRRFCEAIGPRPGRYIMGSETSFLKRLADEGYGIVYSPMAVVGHRIQPEQISISNICKRAYRYGRSVAHTRPLCRQDFFNKHPMFWYILRVAALALLMVKLLVGMLSLTKVRRVEKGTDAIKWFSYNLASIKLAQEKTRKIITCL